MTIRIESATPEAVTVDLGGQPVRITAPAAGVFRLQWADPQGRFVEDGACQMLAALPHSTAKATLEPVSVAGSGAFHDVLGPGGAVLRLASDGGGVSMCHDDGSVATTAVEAGRSGGASWLRGTLTAGERLFGTGERFNGPNQRGKVVRIWAVDKWCQTEGNSYVPIPFVLSDAGWGLLINRYESSELDLGAGSPRAWKISLDHAPLDLYLFLDSTPAAILGKLSLLTGRAPLPPEWAFGVHVCRHARLKEFGTRDGVMAMVRAMEERRLPWSSVILEGWNAYDASRYEELAGLVAEIHAMGKKVLLYEPCGRIAESLLPRGGREHAVRDAGGEIALDESAAYNPADAPKKRRSVFVDVTSAAAVRWWTEEVWGRLVGEIGIDGAKIDFCEQFPEWDSLRFADGRPPWGMHHAYPVLYNTMMHGLYTALRPEGGMCFSRGGSTGAHLYPFLWCGDQLREWRFLRAILSSLLSAGLSGIPFLCHDLAAYMPAKDPEANPEDRVFVRGTEMGCFTVNMQTHGIVTRPYDFPPPIVDIYRLYSRIHYALVPYLREQAALCCATGLPLTRHLVLDWPDDPAAADCDDEYLLGERLLVAPVLDGAEARSVYLPEGRWEGLFDGTRIEGPRRIESLPVPLDRIAVFLRLGQAPGEVDSFVAQARRLLREQESSRVTKAGAAGTLP